MFDSPQFVFLVGLEQKFANLYVTYVNLYFQVLTRSLKTLTLSVKHNQLIRKWSVYVDPAVFVLPFIFFTAQRYASAEYAMARCRSVSVCLSVYSTV